MQTGQEASGMLTFNQSLFNLVVRRHISIQEAMSRSHKPDELQQMLGKLESSPGGSTQVARPKKNVG